MQIKHPLRRKEKRTVQKEKRTVRKPLPSDWKEKNSFMSQRCVLSSVASYATADTPHAIALPSPLVAMFNPHAGVEHKERGDGKVSCNGRGSACNDKSHGWLRLDLSMGLFLRATSWAESNFFGSNPESMSQFYTFATE
ncbi:Hypothetical predicted protein [Olea europaea subsp. europaea]|uniref:Uncharacterized protein n=1 Tax=Olea europaea subsp. europaea TaxID=158383 RepID=A0A8S0TMK0_OLEEU|nr:Hypothetical predicted protein [Olea europaea subsp. europaea]